VAKTKATVLILGETGTGKELIARIIHEMSGRQSRSLVKVNCAALPATLIESELFGHEKGAYTGATSAKAGKFELADKGTIFLDEIGEMPLELQAKLLRVLQEGEFERLGSEQTTRVDVRVIAATNRNLEMLINNGEFREDLYYRLKVFPVICPPLRKRKEDIPKLTHYFIKKYAGEIGRKIETVPEEEIQKLINYHWPGNLREFQNLIESSVITSIDGVFRLETYIDPFGKQAGASLETSGTLEDFERSHIMRVLEACDWKVSGEKGAAQILGMNPQTLFSRMKKMGISRP
jgi:transcriptional regulator with GAF, ATPase, and Fis domain